MLKKISAVFLSSGTLLAFGAVNPHPELLVPQVTAEAMTKASTWEKAAVLRIFTSDQFHHVQIGETTELHLLHDGVNLYAMWNCADATGLPKSPEREPMSDLTLDESVQLVLGSPDVGAVRTRMEMGGYANAQGVELPPVAHYYEFTVNTAGSESRAYNESLLPNPGFTSQVVPEPAGYRVFMTIPLAAAGINPEAGETEFYLNAFRFYRTVRYGWFLPAFGNYAAMPFGKIRLGSAQDSGTVEPPQIGAALIGGAAAKTTTPLNFEAVTLDYYPLARELVAVFPPDGPQREGRLECPKLNLKAAEKLSDSAATIIRLQLPELPAGEVVHGQVAVGDSVREMEFTAQERPDWYANEVAAEYLDKKVAKPWSSPEFTDGELKLAHAEFDFKGHILPTRIQVGKRDLLAGPVELIAQTSDGRIFSSANLAANVSGGDATRVEFATPAVPEGMEMRNIVDFDGFMVVRLRLNRMDARKLQRLSLKIPLQPGVAKYVNRGLVQSVAIVNDADYSANEGYANDLWVGNENIGISVSGDRKVFFSPPDGRQIELKFRPDGGADLYLNYISEIGDAPREDTVFQFFLQPTPMRPETPPPIDNQLALWFEEWTDYQSYPDTTKLPKMREKSAEAHTQGRKLYLYFGQSVAQNAPDMDKFANEIFAPPDRPWYRRSYDPGKGVPCSVACFRGAWGDLILQRVAQFADEGNIDGVYLDGAGNPFDCANPSHQCNDDLPVDFNDDARHGRVLGHRQFLKRLRGIFDARGKTFPIWMHTGGALDLSTMALTDFHFEGEQLARYKQGYLLEPQKFIVGYSGVPFGFRTIFLPMIYSDAAGIDRAVSWSLVHGVEASTGGSSGSGHYSSTTQDAFFRLARTDATAKFHPYWTEQKHIRRLSHDRSYISYYRTDREAVLAAAHFDYTGPQTVRLDLSGMFDTPVNAVEDMGSGEIIPLQNSQLEFTVDEGRYRAFRIRSDGMEIPESRPETAAVEFAPILGYRSEDWNLIHVKKTDDDKIADQFHMPLSIRGIADSGEAKIVFAPQTPTAFTMRLRLLHGEALRLRYRSLIVLFNAWDGWQIDGIKTGDPVGRVQAWHKWLDGAFYGVTDRPIPVEFGVDGNRVTLIYDGQYFMTNCQLENADDPTPFTLETWGDRPLMLDVESIVTGMNLPEETKVHPVRLQEYHAPSTGSK